MRWAVVTFPKEQSVEVVPILWYVKDSQECFWPPAGTKRSKIAFYIKNCDDPQSNWVLHAAVLLGEYSELNIAEKKARKAETTSDLSSSNDVFGRGHRPKKQNLRYEKTDDSSREESSDDNVYPSPYQMQKNPYGTVVSPDLLEESQTNQRKSRSPLRRSPQNSSICRSRSTPPKLQPPKSVPMHSQSYPSSSRCSPPKSQPLNNTPVTFQSCIVKRPFRNTHSTPRKTTTPTSIRGGRRGISSEDENYQLLPLHKDTKLEENEGLLKTIVEEMSLLHLKIDAVMDKVSAIIKILSLQSASIPSINDETIEHLYKHIPVHTEEGLQLLENWLDTGNNYKVMIMELNRIGGNGMSQSIRKILYRVLSNEVAQHYSWDGAKQKKSFKKLKLSNSILDAVKIQFRETTETEVINVIKIWLVKAKERMKNKEMPAENAQDNHE